MLAGSPHHPDPRPRGNSSNSAAVIVIHAHPPSRQRPHCAYTNSPEEYGRRCKVILAATNSFLMIVPATAGGFAPAGEDTRRPGGHSAGGISSNTAPTQPLWGLAGDFGRHLTVEDAGGVEQDAGVEAGPSPGEMPRRKVLDAGVAGRTGGYAPRVAASLSGFSRSNRDGSRRPARRKAPARRWATR